MYHLRLLEGEGRTRGAGGQGTRDAGSARESLSVVHSVPHRVSNFSGRGVEGKGWGGAWAQHLPRQATQVTAKLRLALLGRVCDMAGRHSRDASTPQMCRRSMDTMDSHTYNDCSLTVHKESGSDGDVVMIKVINRPDL